MSKKYVSCHQKSVTVVFCFARLITLLGEVAAPRACHTMRLSLFLLVAAVGGLQIHSPVRTRRTVLRLAPDDPPLEPTLPSQEAAPSSQERMKAKLQAEAEYPLFAPLMFGSAVIGGKGLTDALLTVAKVSAGIRGASLAETFLGVPVLLIDALCVVAGISLARYTWTTMRSA